MVYPQAGISGILEGLAAHFQRDLGHFRIVVQAGSRSGLQVIGIAHVSLAGLFSGAGSIESKLVAVQNDLSHKQAVCRMQLSQLRSLEGHMIPVHVKAVISCAAEEIRTVRIDTGNDHDVDIIQQSFGLRVIDKVVHDDQSTLAGGGLIGMDLSLIPNGGLSILLHQLSSLFQSGVGRDLGVGEDGQRNIKVVVGSFAGGIEVHIVALLIPILHELYHLVLSGELMGGVRSVKGGRVILLVVGGIFGGEVLQDLVGPDAQHGIPGVHHIGVRSLRGLYRGLIAVAELIIIFTQGTADHFNRDALVHIVLGDVDDLQDVIISVAGDVIAIHARLCSRVASISIRFDFFQLTPGDHFLQGAAGRGGEASIKF